MSPKLVLAFVLFSLVSVGGTVWLVARMSGPSTPAQVQASGEAKAVVTETSWDWGDIGINNGKVDKSFDITNDGTAPLKLFAGTTSCACTNAQLILGDKQSGVFGMHAKSAVFEVPAGATAQLKVVFDPLFHGPSGLGSISRTATIKTNDPSQSQLSFTLTANVIK